MAQTTQKPDLPEKKEDNDFPHRSYLNLTSIAGGIILIWLGVVLFLDNQGYLEWPWWQYFIPGLGVILLIEGFGHFRQEKNLGFLLGRLIAGGALITWGITFLLGLNQWWPLFIVGAGAVIVIMRLVKR